LGGSEESDPENRIWDSIVNMYVASDTDEEEGSQADEVEIRGEELSDLESINQPGNERSACIAVSRGPWKRIVRRRRLYREPLIHYRLLR